MKRIVLVLGLFLCLLLCSISFATAETLVPSSYLPAEPIFEPSKEYAEYTVVEYRIPGIDATVNCTVNRKGDRSEYYVQCDLYGDNSASRSIIQNNEFVIIESSSGLMEHVTLDILKMAKDQNIWVKTAGTYDDSILPFAPVFMPINGYDEYTTVKYTVDGIDQELLCTISRRADNTDYYLECSLYGDNLVSHANYSEAVLNILESNSGIIGIITPNILDKAIKQDIWLPITEKTLASAENAMLSISFPPAKEPASARPTEASTESSGVAFPEEIHYPVWGRTNAKKVNVREAPAGKQIAQIADLETYVWLLGTEFKSDTTWYHFMWEDSHSNVREGYIRTDLVAPLSQEDSDLYQSTLPSPAPVITVVPVADEPTETPAEEPTPEFTTVPTVKPTAEPTTAPITGHARVIQDTNIHSTPNEKSVLLDHLTKEDVVVILGQIVDEETDWTWHQIQYGTTTGYLRADTLTMMTDAENSAYVNRTPEPTQTPSEPNDAHATSTASTQASFTNKYGTSTTKCAHHGCNNYIASSGDTNCCTIHSRKCLECGKYIDEDATYCMDCIKKAAGAAAKDSGRKCDASGCSKAASKTLIVTQPSGESAAFYLCPSHYSEYKSLFNSKQGWKAE